MATRFGTVHEGRRLEVEPEAKGLGTVVRLLADGAPVAETTTRGRDATLEIDGTTIDVRLAWHGNSVTHAVLTAPGGSEVELEPEPGSAAARRARFAREHPGLYAVRHAAKGIGKALGPLIGIGLLLGLLPRLSLPLPDLPRIPLPDLPSLPLPALDLPDLPDLALPAWLAAILATAKIWGPILVGVVLAVREYRRRRRREPAELSGSRGRPPAAGRAPRPATPGRPRRSSARTPM